jgi:transcriptional regulator with XRE-family HTH domain
VPRPNPPRDVYAERYLAQRIARERESRGWTYESLASRMTAAGCPLNQSAIYKIERSDPPRRITVDELVGYSKVFGISVEQLLLDPEIDAEARVIEHLNVWRQLSAERVELVREYDERINAVETTIRRLVTSSKGADRAMENYFVQRFPEDSHWPADVSDTLRGN